MAKKTAPAAVLPSWLALGFSETDLEIAVGRRAPRLALLTEVFSLARQVHGERARAWFLAPEPALGGVLPATLLRDPSSGPELVKQALRNALHGPVR